MQHHKIRPIYYYLVNVSNLDLVNRSYIKSK